MSSQFGPQQQPPYYQEPPAKQSGNGCLWGILIGCGGMILISVLLCVGGVWWLQQNAGKLVAGFARDAIVATINSSEIPEGEKTEVIAQVDRVVNAYKAGQIDEQDLERLMKEFESSPAFLLISAWGLETAYLEPSSLPDEEKEAGRRTIQRAFRGLCEKKITTSQFQEVAPQSDFEASSEVKVEDGKTVIKQRSGPRDPLTDEEVREMLAKLKKLADDASIPDEPFTIDIGNEVKKAVDQALPDKGEQ